MAKQLRSIQEQVFKGYNDRVPAELVPRRYLADLKNGFVTANKIEKRKGYSLIANDLGANACQGIRGVEFADGTKKLIAVFNGDIYTWSGSGNWASPTGSTGKLATSGYVDIVPANNNVYFFDGTNTVPKYTLSTDAVTTVAAIPIGTGAIWFHNFLFVFGVASEINTLQVSTVNDPEAGYGASDNVEVNPNDGDRITGLGVLEDRLMIFKRNRIWSLSGFGPSQFTLSDLNERISGFGTSAYRSIVSSGNDILYLSFLGDVPHFRSLKRTTFATTIDGGILSLDIEGSMGGLNNSQLSLVSGIFDGRKFWMACPNSGSAFNNIVFVYDIVDEGWSRHTGINSAQFTTFPIGTTPAIYFGEASADSKAYELDNSTSDNGAAIDFSVDTRRYGVENMALKKKYKYLYVTADETGNWDIDVDYNVDGFTYVDLDTINVGTAGAVFDDIILGTSRLGETDMNTTRLEIPKVSSYYYQLRFANANADEDVSIRSWDLQYLFKGPRDAPN